MKRFFLILAAVFGVTLSAQAGDIITATVIVSDADELTNNASITLGSDTRIWTNSVTTPATQIRSSTTEANAAFNLLQHFRAYPFADVQLQATNNGVVFIGEEGDALSLTITNAWATVAYRTNTVSSATVVRVPYTVEPAANRVTTANRIKDWLGLADEPVAVAELTVNDDAYDADWNGSTNVPTKNAIYDKIETLSSGGGSGIQTLNTLSGTNQTFSVGTSGTDFAISSSGTNHTFNLPTASGSNRGALSTADWTTFNGKQGAITTAEQISDFLDLIDDTHGAILFRASGGWTNLPPGTSGKVLKSNGAAADPSWEDDDTGAPGSGDDVHVNGSDVTHPDFDDSTTIEWSVSGTNVTAGVKDNSIALGTKTTGNYAAGDAEAGAATSGDSATAFFSSGTIEDARLPSTQDNKTLTSAIVTLNGTADGLTDDTYDGITITGRNAGETVAQWELVRFNSADSEFHLADADAAGEFPARGIAVAASTDGNAITVLVQGVVRNDGWAWGTVGGPIYLSTTAGGLTQTAPSTSGNAVQIVGWALSDDEAYLNFSGHWVEAP